MWISDDVRKAILNYLDLYLAEEENSDYRDSHICRELDSLISILENKVDLTVKNS